MTADIRVLVPYFAWPDLLLECAASIAAQDLRPLSVGLHYDGFPEEHAYISDGFEEAARLLQSAGIDLTCSWSGHRAGELASVLQATEWQDAHRPMSPSTVLVHFCADDLLPDPGVLSSLVEIYEDPDAWMTYGGYAYEDGTPGHCQPYPAEAHERGDYRGRPWQASHLRSYRYGLWSQVPPSQFVDPETGAVWFYATDRAMMYPMLELARDHARYLSPDDESWYTYRRHPGNVPSLVDANHCERVAAMPRLERTRGIHG